MTASKAQIRASTKWNASRDSITIRIDKDTGAKIRAAAAAAGQSVTQYIVEAVRSYMRLTGDVQKTE